MAELQTELNELNRRRNEHQARGKRKLSPPEREAHVAEGRRLKEEVARAERRLDEAQAILRERLSELPNFVHPEAPVGGALDEGPGTEEGAELRRQLQDHVKAAIAPYKYPREIELRTELPKTGTGKVQRFVLRQEASS